MKTTLDQDSQQQKRQRPKTRDLRTLQAIATEAASVAAVATKEAEKAKEISAKASARAREARAKAIRKIKALEDAKKKDILRRLGQLWAKNYSSMLPEDKKKYFNYYIKSGFSEDDLQLIGICRF